MLGIGFDCFIAGLMLGNEFVCLSVFCGKYVWHWVCLFVSLLGDLCLALRLSVICWTYVGHLVCLFLCWGTYVWHCVCLLFVELMLGIGFVCLLVG